MKIEKYNQIIWGVIGTAMVISIFLIIAGSTLSLFIGSQSQKGVRVRQSRKPEAASRTEEKAVYREPIITDYSEYVMIPVEVREISKGRIKDIGKYESLSRSYYDNSYSKVSYIYYGFYGVRFHNVIFYNKNSGRSHLLLNKKAVISSFYFPYEKENEKDKPCKKFLLFGISDKDTNGDGIINEKDAIIGYVSDLVGQQLQQITPENTQLIDWRFDKNIDAIFVRVKKDSDNDKVFSDRDNISVLRINISNPSIGVEIISDQINKEVSLIFN